MQKEENLPRRRFIRTAALGSITLGSIAALSIPQIVSASMPAASKKKIKLSKGNTVLFQGDSITDAGRNHNEQSPNNTSAFGSGYPMLAGAKLLNSYASLDLKIYNKGISGNKVFQLAERWEQDCFNLKPDVLSLMIGVNDFWHTLDGNYNGTPEIYEKDYIALMEKTRKVLPDIQIIIIEPYAVKSSGAAVNDKWYPLFDEYRKAADRVAKIYANAWIPMQSIFDKAEKYAPGKYWAGDGVHPSIAGASLIAESWLSVF